MTVTSDPAGPACHRRRDRSQRSCSLLIAGAVVAILGIVGTPAGAARVRPRGVGPEPDVKVVELGDGSTLVVATWQGATGQVFVNVQCLSGGQPLVDLGAAATIPEQGPGMLAYTIGTSPGINDVAVLAGRGAGGSRGVGFHVSGVMCPPDGWSVNLDGGPGGPALDRPVDPGEVITSPAPFDPAAPLDPLGPPLSGWEVGIIPVELPPPGDEPFSYVYGEDLSIFGENPSGPAVTSAGEPSPSCEPGDGTGAGDLTNTSPFDLVLPGDLGPLETDGDGPEGLVPFGNPPRDDSGDLLVTFEHLLPPPDRPAEPGPGSPFWRVGDLMFRDCLGDRQQPDGRYMTPPGDFDILAGGAAPGPDGSVMVGLVLTGEGPNLLGNLAADPAPDPAGFPLFSSFCEVGVTGAGGGQATVTIELHDGQLTNTGSGPAGEFTPEWQSEMPVPGTAVSTLKVLFPGSALTGTPEAVSARCGSMPTPDGPFSADTLGAATTDPGPRPLPFDLTEAGVQRSLDAFIRSEALNRTVEAPESGGDDGLAGHTVLIVVVGGVLVVGAAGWAIKRWLFTPPLP